MSIRENLQNNSGIGIAIVILLLAATTWFVRSGGRDRKPGEQMYYYDLTTGGLFIAAHVLPPVPAPSGEADQGVLARVFSCGDCSEGQRQVMWIEKYSDDAKSVLVNPPQGENARQEIDAARQTGWYIAEPPAAGEPAKWILGVSDEAAEMMQAYVNLCNGKKMPTPCMP